MTEINQDYKCNVCGNVVKIVKSGQGILICCGQPMELITVAAVTQPTPTEEISSTPEITVQETAQAVNPEVSEPPVPEENPTV